MKHKIAFEKDEIEHMLDILDLAVQQFGELSLAKSHQIRISVRVVKNLRRKFQAKLDLEIAKTTAT